MRMQAKACWLAVAAAIAIGGCGGSDTKDDRKLSGDELLAVNDELVVCLQKEDVLGITVAFRGGEARAANEGFGAAKYDSSVAAPKATKQALEAKKGRFIGVRADRRRKPGTPDVDFLLLRSEEDAKAVAEQAQTEAASAAKRHGIIVEVPLRRASSKFRERAGKALERCADQARAAAPD